MSEENVMSQENAGSKTNRTEFGTIEREIYVEADTGSRVRGGQQSGPRQAVVAG